jgi:hypothetical protein
MLIYEKVKETTAHLPSDRPIKNRHLEVTIWSSMKNVIFTSPNYRGIGEVTIVTTRPFSQGSENGRCSYDWGRWKSHSSSNSCYFFRKIRDMRPNNDAWVDLKRRMIVLTGTRCTYFELKTTHKAFCMVILIKKEKCLLFKHEKNNQTLSNDWPNYCHTKMFDVLPN